MEFWTIFLTVIVGAICVYLFAIRHYSYFKRLGIPHLRPNLIFGNMSGLAFRTKTMVDIFQETYDLHPDAKYCGVYEIYNRTILVRDPELVKYIAIKNFDYFPNHKMFVEPSIEPLFDRNLMALKNDEWRNMRGVLSPAFTSSKMKIMFEILAKCAVDFSDHLAKQNPQPENLDMKDTFGRYTLDVIASAAFGLSVNSMKDRDNDFYRLGTSVADITIFKMFKFFVLSFFPWVMELFDMRFLDRKTSSFFRNIIKTTVATRHEQGIVRPDMIHLMMQARDKEDKSTLSSEDMTAQALIFLLAGFESPATAMSFAAHLLAMNPDIQRKLQTEIDEVLERSPGEVSYEDLHAMKYLDAVVSETLRIYPPSPVLDRVASKSFSLPPALPGLKPFETKLDSHILIPVYSFHHDPKYFPDPEKFDPERFSEDNKSKINPLTYLPFGLGPRMCIANRFALMEVKLALFYLLAKCNLLPASKTQSQIKLSTKSFFMVPEGGFWLKVESRKKDCL